jgi:peptidoglycan/LPS O-acetylase OafA/YrhL
MSYRKDIQILRGLSVLFVVLYHLEALRSGLLGVDVFFVISGYLMAALYDPNQKADFFWKRARRLLPAYFVVVLVTLVVSVVRTNPDGYRQVANQALVATTFTSNIGFWLATSYFDNAAFKPLMHLWSLGVEIQFYLLIPVLFWALRRLRGSYFLLLFGSLAACCWMLHISSRTAFFLMPFRLWEFLLGYGVAAHVSNEKRDGRPFVAWLGALFLIVLLGLPFLTVDGFAPDVVHGHPGLIALATGLATAGVLAVGLPPRLEAFRLATALEHLGRYSYSVYLVHYPTIVLFLYRPFWGTVLRPDSLGQLLVLIAAIAGLSLLLYHFVETPLRAGRRTPRFVLACAAAIVVVGPTGAALQRSLIPEKEMLIYQAAIDRPDYRCGQVYRMLHPTAISCEITAPLDAPRHRVLLVGDSHADAIKATFASAAQSKNIALRFMVKNDPLVGGGITPKALIDEARSHQIDAIVLHYSTRSMDAATVEEVIALASEHHIAVSYLLPTPVWPDHVPFALWKNMKQQAALPTLTARDYDEVNRPLIEGLAALHHANFRVYPTVDRFCQDVCRMVTPDSRPLYFDSWHLTLTGSEVLRGTFDRLLSELQTASEPGG